MLLFEIFLLKFSYNEYCKKNYDSKIRCINSFNKNIIEEKYFVDFLDIIIKKYDLSIYN